MEISENKILSLVQLKKYELCSKFTAENWRSELLERMHLSGSLYNSEVHWSYMEESKFKTLVLKHIESPLFSDSFSRRPEDIQPIRVKASEAIRDLLIGDLWNGKLHIKNRLHDISKVIKKWESAVNKKLNADRFNDSVLKTPSSYDESYHSAMLDRHDRLHESYLNHIYLEVDLKRSDQELKDSFSIWLSRKRAEMIGKSTLSVKAKSYSPKDFDKWCNLKILAYVDILILMKLFNIHISNFKIGEHLYSDENDFSVDISERVRKTTGPLAKKLLNPSTIFHIK